MKTINFSSNIFYVRNYSQSSRCFFNELRRKTITISRKEQNELAVLAKNGCAKSREKLIHSCLKMVLSIAKYYSDKALYHNNDPAIEYFDLVSEGSIGLSNSIDCYKPGSKSADFYVFSSFYIRGGIMNFINHTKQVKVSTRVISLYNRLRKLIEKWSFGNEELCFEKLFQESNKIVKLTKEELEVVLGFLDYQILYIDSSTDDFAEEDCMISKKIEKEDLNSDLMTAMESLSTKEKDIVISHYGIGKPKECTLEVIAKKYKITREAIRLSEKIGLHKMKYKIKYHPKKIYGSSYNKNKKVDWKNSDINSDLKSYLGSI